MKIKLLWISLICMLLTISGCGMGINQAQDTRETKGIDLSRYYEGRGTKQNQTMLESPRPYGQISDQSTETPSDEYPHTKAIQVQHAKYGFISVDKEGKEQKVQLPEEVTRNLPEGYQNLSPEQISRLLPQDMSNLLPKGTEHLTPEAIAKLIKQGAGQGQPGMTPGQGQGAQPQPEQRAEAQTPTPMPERAETAPAPEQGQPQTAPQQPAKQEETKAPAPKSEGLSALESKVIELTNQERRKNGLSDLQADTSLSNVARQKSNDMQANNYFSHTSPTYGSPFDMMRDFGISYNAAAENIAQGQQSAEEVVQAWMNSEGHRKNILNGGFTHIGVGHTANGNYWTQMFISK